jgi:hypothetical protein
MALLITKLLLVPRLLDALDKAIKVPVPKRLLIA